MHIAKLSIRALLVPTLLLLLAACGGDDEPASGDDDTGGGDGGGQPAASGGGGGSLTIGDEQATVDSARCYLEEQDVSGSPGKILINAQGSGTLADGTEFVIDVTRYDEESLFTGDDIEVDVGDFRSEDFYYWIGSLELGTVERDGSTLSVDSMTFRNSEDGREVEGSFELDCP